MSTQTIASPAGRPIGAYVDPGPLVRPLPFPIQEGVLWTAGLDEDGRPADDEMQAQWLRVTPVGHWYMSEDQSAPSWECETGVTRCRGCGAVAEFTFELDEQRCTHPATADGIASALLAPVRRPAPIAPRRYCLRTWREGLVTA